jgi:hypothetical protein
MEFRAWRCNSSTIRLWALFVGLGLGVLNYDLCSASSDLVLGKNRYEKSAVAKVWIPITGVLIFGDVGALFGLFWGH